MTCHCSRNLMLPWQPYIDRAVFPNLEFSFFFNPMEPVPAQTGRAENHPEIPVAAQTGRK